MKKEHSIVSCLYCNKQFVTPMWRIRQGKGKFCSKNCFTHSQERRIVKFCLICGNKFSVKFRRGYTAKYCSSVCRPRKGRNNPFYGEKHSQRTREKMKLVWKIRKEKGYVPKNKQELYKNCVICKKKFKLINFTFNKYHCCSRECSGKYKSLYFIGEKSANWIDGRSYFPYPPEFNKSLKKKIRLRDGQKCQNCNTLEDLSVHHINYNKNDCSESNLITLCMRCNSSANGRREYWTAYYKNKLNYV